MELGMSSSKYHDMVASYKMTYLRYSSYLRLMTVFLMTDYESVL